MKESEQVILCEGCDSKWVIDASKLRSLCAWLSVPSA